MDMRAQNQALRAAMDRLLAANAELTDRLNAQAARAAAAPPPEPARMLPGAPAQQRPTLEPLPNMKVYRLCADSKTWFDVDHGADFGTQICRRAPDTRASSKAYPAHLGFTSLVGPGWLGAEAS